LAIAILASQKGRIITRILLANLSENNPLKRNGKIAAAGIAPRERIGKTKGHQFMIELMAFLVLF